MATLTMGNYKNRIEINPKILLGKPVFKGTRIPLYVVLDMLSEGMAAKEIIEAYPDLDKDDIKAAMLFASDAAKHISEIEFASADR